MNSDSRQCVFCKQLIHTAIRLPCNHLACELCVAVHQLGMYPDEVNYKVPHHRDNKTSVLTNSPSQISEICYFCPDPACGTVFKEAGSLHLIYGPGVFDRSIDESIRAMTVNCPRRGTAGCDFSGTVEELRESHEDLCPAKFVNCPFVRGCRAKMMRVDLAQHFTTDCLGCPFFCHGCGNSFPAIEQEQHIEQCNYALRSCGICGQGGFNADTLALHKTTAGSCSALDGPCPYSPFGCPMGNINMTPCFRKGHLAEYETHHRELMLSALTFAYNVSGQVNSNITVFSTPSTERSETVAGVARLRSEFVRLEATLVAQMDKLESDVKRVLQNVVTKDGAERMLGEFYGMNKKIDDLRMATDKLQQELYAIQSVMDKKSTEKVASKAKRNTFPCKWIVDNINMTNGTRFQSPQIFSCTGHSFRILVDPEYVPDDAHEKVLGIAVCICSSAKDNSSIPWPISKKFSFTIQTHGSKTKEKRMDTGWRVFFQPKKPCNQPRYAGYLSTEDVDTLCPLPGSFIEVYVEEITK